MATEQNYRRIFGPYKYAALHLLLGRWVRRYASEGNHAYVTLGGTELRDVESLHFIDPKLLHEAVSYETEAGRHQLAKQSSLLLAEAGIKVRIENSSFFDYSRQSNLPHIFFLDLEYQCTLADYYIRFGEMFQNEVIREGDALLVTSYLPARRGWKRLYDTFDAEFRILKLHTPNEKQALYKIAHPSFALYKGLDNRGLQNEVKLSCFGCVEYRDTSSMAIYGYLIQEGKTNFRELVGDIDYYNLKVGYQAASRHVKRKIA